MSIGKIARHFHKMKIRITAYLYLFYILDGVKVGDISIFSSYDLKGTDHYFLLFTCSELTSNSVNQTIQGVGICVLIISSELKPN